MKDYMGVFVERDDPSPRWVNGSAYTCETCAHDPSRDEHAITCNGCARRWLSTGIKHACWTPRVGH